MPIDAGSQPMHKRNPDAWALQEVVHGVYTVEDTMHMYQYLFGEHTQAPASVTTDWGATMDTVRALVQLFEAAHPHTSIAHIKALHALGPRAKQWAGRMYGIYL
jgi:hypothetical protein